MCRRRSCGEALDGNGDDDHGASEWNVGGAGGFSLDSGLDGAERVLQAADETQGVGGAELIDEGGDLALEVGLVVNGALAVRTMAGAEALSAFGDTAAFAAGFVDVFAFVDHGFLRKPAARSR